MTGIERLREFAKGCRLIGQKAYSDAICDIADQIERERECDADTIENLRLELGEARDDAAWVRAHGGLDHVREEWRSRVPYDRYERRRHRLLGHIAECETALRRRNQRINELGHHVSDLTAENAKLRRRAMPEGIEWPRFEDREPVHIGDEVSVTVHDEDGDFERSMTADSISFNEHGIIVCDPRHVVRLLSGERVRRPEPKVLDADGVEIRVGDTVYHVKDGSEMTVYGIEGEWLVVSVGGRVRHDVVTHRAPVLAADGEPLEVGQTVWDTNGDELVIGALEDGGHTVNCRYADVGDAIPVHGMWSPSDLTHTKPEIDTWERIERDAKVIDETIEIEWGGDCTDALDIVRRARALAERERGE